MISTNLQAKLNRENAKPFKWKLFPDFTLLGGIIFLGTIAIMGAV